MSPQCSACGAYYTGNEGFCSRCGAQRVYNPPYQTDYQGQQPFQQQQSGFGGWAQNYYTPQRIVRRMVIGRIIGLAIVLFILGVCAVIFLLSILASAAHP